MQTLVNSAVRRDAAFRGRFSAEEYAAVEAFYRSRPSLHPTPLRELSTLAALLGLASVVVKDESQRFGLGAFKALGSRYAMERLGASALRGGVVCATAGNHGRAVANAAREMLVPCTIFVPSLSQAAGPIERAIRAARVEGMRADRAHVVDVEGTYEQAVELAAAYGAETGATIISDTGWPGYESIPHDIMAGYTHLFAEASRQWTAAPDVVVVQAGVGGLLCAAASWLAFNGGAGRPFLIASEPDGFDCCLESARVGGPVRITSTTGHTFMAGLRCTEPSHAARQTVRDGVDAFVSIPDSYTEQAMSVLASKESIDAGPSGACGVGALLALAADPLMRAVRESCRLGRSTRAMAIITEGK